MEAARWVTIAQQSAHEHRNRCEVCQAPPGRRSSCEALRLDVAAQLAHTLEFPLRVAFRGHIVRRRQLKASGLVERWPWPGSEVVVIEVVPERFGAEAYAAVGGVLIHEPQLEAPSVVSVTAKLLNPASYKLRPPGLIAAEAEVRAEVRVCR